MRCSICDVILEEDFNHEGTMHDDLCAVCSTVVAISADTDKDIDMDKLLIKTTTAKHKTQEEINNAVPLTRLFPR